MDENSDLQRQLKEAKDIVKLTETVTPLSTLHTSLSLIRYINLLTLPITYPLRLPINHSLYPDLSPSRCRYNYCIYASIEFVSSLMYHYSRSLLTTIYDDYYL